MSTLKHTPINEINGIHARLRKTFKDGKTLPLAFRRKQLLQLARMIQENIEAIEEASLADLGKPRLETTVAESGAIIGSALRAAEHLEEWTKPVKPQTEAWRSSWDATIYNVPKGVALIISPWNYPFVLTFNPLVGAIAAGCPAVIKPSEVTPTCAALMADLVGKYLDPDAYALVNGAVEETVALLDLRWDHIFFTGGGKIGKIIAQAAAKHLTPVTLELGGKSPVVIDEGCDLEIAAKRTLYGKLQNSGQLCVSPDHVYVIRSLAPAFTKALQKAYRTFWPETALHPDARWGKIVNPSHHGRVKDILDRTLGVTIAGGEVDGNRRIAPTVVSGVQSGDSLMEDEIFGPILPVLEVDDIDEAISLISAAPSPLVIYVFTTNEKTKEKFLNHTTSGSLVLNDTYMQLAVHELPFGGHGASGYGAYFDKESFNLFTHRRSHINVPYEQEPNLAFRYPPYTEESYQALTVGARVKIPDE